MAFGHTFRFYGTFGEPTSVTVSRKELLNLVLVATSGITTARIFEAIRLTRLRLWVNPPTGGSVSTTGSIEWVGQNAPSIIKQDTSMGIEPAYVQTKPPPRSSDQWWSMSGSDESDDLFTITVYGTAILDVHVSVRLVDTEAPTAGSVPVAATLGQLYYNYLDSDSSSVWVPQGGTVLP